MDDALHAELEDRLGAYLDDELAPEDAARLEMHLLACERCRHGLEVQRRIRSRLAAGPIQPAPEALRDRIRAAIRRPPPAADQAEDARTRPGGDAPRRAPDAASRAPAGRPDPALTRRLAPWLGWAVAAAVALAWLGTARPLQVREPEAIATGRAAVPQIPMIEEALADYRRLATSELPIRAADPRTLEAALPFPVTTLPHADARLIGTWTTVIRGEPAGVLAYRLGDHVLIQYVVSEPLFFRQPVVRQAVAREGVYRTADGAQGVVAWPNRGSGTILVGDLPVDRLERLRS